MTDTDRAAVTGGASHHMRTDTVRSRAAKVLIVVATPTRNQYGGRKKWEGRTSREDRVMTTDPIARGPVW